MQISSSKTNHFTRPALKSITLLSLLKLQTWIPYLDWISFFFSPQSFQPGKFQLQIRQFWKLQVGENKKF